MFNQKISKLALDNTNFRTVLFTTKLSQLVVMSLKPGEDIGLETHGDVDQILTIVAGNGVSILNGEERSIEPDSVVVVPAGTSHNFVNSTEGEMKLWTIYTPPEHRDGTIHVTKADAMTDEEDHFE